MWLLDGGAAGETVRGRGRRGKRRGRGKGRWWRGGEKPFFFFFFFLLILLLLLLLLLRPLGFTFRGWGDGIDTEAVQIGSGA